MNKLPMWHITNIRPSNFDTESLTIIEQTARVYGAMNALIEEYNDFSTKLNEAFEKNEIEASEAFDVYKMKMNQLFNDFSDVVELKIESFDKTSKDSQSKLDESIKYMERSISQFKTNIDTNLKDYADETLKEIVSLTYSAFYYDASNQEIGYQTMVGAEYDMSYDPDSEQITVLGSVTNNANESVNYQLIQALDTRLTALGG